MNIVANSMIVSVQITLVHFKDLAVQAAGNSPPLQPISSYSVASSGDRYAASKPLGSSGNYSRMLGFAGGNEPVVKEITVRVRVATVDG